jgi:cathepsin X
MQQEIMSRGPISCGIDAMPLLNYESGIFKQRSFSTDHVISVVGWGKDEVEGSYWIVRNSWGEFWGEMGYVRVGFGGLHVESGCAWAVPGEFTSSEKNNQVHCHEGGDNCNGESVVV